MQLIIVDDDANLHVVVPRLENYDLGQPLANSAVMFEVRTVARRLARRTAAIAEARLAQAAGQSLGVGDLKPGKLYSFTYRSDAQRRDRIDILRFLELTEHDVILDARPIAGTQKMPRSWIKAIRVAPQGAGISVSRQ